MKVKVMSMYDAEEYASNIQNKNVVFISITSTGGMKANIIPNKYNKIKDVIHLKVNDVDLENLGGMNKSHAKRISDFVKRYEHKEDIEEIIVHCEAGRSRSAGVAAAIMKYLFNDDREIFNNKYYTPNMLCYRTVLNELYTK